MKLEEVLTRAKLSPDGVFDIVVETSTPIDTDLVDRGHFCQSRTQVLYICHAI